ncbi:MAG TPA: TatD family hydrolase [Candidatus Paceibacterota bacterium]|jgi:TatD DNase family protein
MRYFDAHCHIQFPHYDEDRDTVMAAMRNAEVGGLVVGTDLVSSQKAVELVQGSETLWATVGLHPNSANEWGGNRAYRELLKDPKVVGVGECGLDNYRPEDPAATKAKQREVFEAHIALAVESNKPLMIHSRPSKGTSDAYRDMLDILRAAKNENSDLRGNIHFFVGGVEEAKAFLELDFTLSFTAVLTFARDYDEVVSYVPLSHIISETDAPYIAPPPNRGKRNDPLAVIPVVEAIAGIRNEELETVRIQVLENARKLFKLT